MSKFKKGDIKVESKGTLTWIHILEEYHTVWLHRTPEPVVEAAPTPWAVETPIELVGSHVTSR